MASRTGRLDRLRLEAVTQESWFEPGGLLLVEENSRLRGFCWTRLDRQTHPPTGAIWAIAVAPDARKEGLGQQLLTAGVGHLAAQGCRDATLYVDASNRGALGLFINNGFVVRRIERLYGEAPLRVPPFA